MIIILSYIRGEIKLGLIVYLVGMEVFLNSYCHPLSGQLGVI